MNMEEAYALASAGHRITHEHFSSHEYLENRFGALVAEDGVPFNEEYVRRYKSNDWNAVGWRLREEHPKRDAGKDLVELLARFNPTTRDECWKENISFDEHRPPFEVSFGSDKATDNAMLDTTVVQIHPQPPADTFVPLLVRAGLTAKESETASKKLLSWLEANRYYQEPGVTPAFYSNKTKVHLTFKCQWMALRTFEQLIKFYE